MAMAKAEISVSIDEIFHKTMLAAIKEFYKQTNVRIKSIDIKYNDYNGEIETIQISSSYTDSGEETN
jgi:hypothetical protein